MDLAGGRETGRLDAISINRLADHNGEWLTRHDERTHQTGEPGLGHRAQDLIKGLARFLDTQLLDPAVVAIANQNPGSVTSTAPSYGSSGTSGPNALSDFKRGIELFTAANENPGTTIVITTPRIAGALAVAAQTQTVGPKGGTLNGYDVLTTPAAVNVATGAHLLVFVDAEALVFADDSGIEIDASQQASIEMRTDTTSPVVAGTRRSIYSRRIWPGCA